jgi:hypothetical protein
MIKRIEKQKVLCYNNFVETKIIDDIKLFVEAGAKNSLAYYGYGEKK